ncbi:MAG: ornithine carbamoyltransferase [Endomicrobium sp.]|jgi:ornithine carbamoyltransferase|nr:ornithine carbamoyltransferase [Endomicrobium sp.]
MSNIKHLLSIYDLSKQNIYELLYQAFEFKKNKEHNHNICYRKTLGLMFDKPSTRTIVSFIVAMTQLSGNPIVLDVNNLQLKHRESIQDTAMVLSQYLDSIVIRTFDHHNIEKFAKFSSIPIINGLTNSEHPCQVLSDIMTIMELYNINTVKDLAKLNIVYIGDGSNNISCSLLGIVAILGLHYTIISPSMYCPKIDVLNKSLLYSSSSKANIKVTTNIDEIHNADVIYTDVWTSMGYENERYTRKQSLMPYQVNSILLQKASKNCIVLHCLPAVKGEEITSDIMERYKYSIIKQSENKLYMQKSILAYVVSK